MGAGQAVALGVAVVVLLVLGAAMARRRKRRGRPRTGLDRYQAATSSAQSTLPRQALRQLR